MKQTRQHGQDRAWVGAALEDALDVGSPILRSFQAGELPALHDIADGFSADLEFNQLDRASKAMRTISREMRRVVDAPDLPTLQRYGADLARDRRLRPKIAALRRGKSWGDLGDLKRELLDLWTEERNTLAKAVMQDIETQRKGTAR